MIIRAQALSYKEMKTKKALWGDKIPHGTCVISILDPSAPRIFPDDAEQVITLRFHDIEPRHVKGLSEDRTLDFIPMSKDDAEKIVTAVRRWHGQKQRITVFVNCMAGISRSAATAEFIQIVCELNWDTFRRMHEVFFPNGYVKRMLLKAWKKRDVIA